MAKLNPHPRPQGQSTDYLFVKNGDTGSVFKARHELRKNDAGQPVAAISIAPVDASGKALLNDIGEPDVKWHTHVFTEVELSDPAFDEEARVATVLDQMVEEKENEKRARERVKNLAAGWGTAAFDLSKRVPGRPAVEK